MIEDDIKKAEQARHLLDNPLLNEILTSLKNAFVEYWLSSDPTDKEKRERLYIAAQVVDDFAKNMRIILERGAITKAIIKRKQDREGL